MNPLKRIKREPKPLSLLVEAEHNNARTCTMTLPHGPVKTPVYMPVGTKGTIKGLTPSEVANLDCWLLLGNTYHLNNSPGADYLGLIGGLRAFMSWPRNILTDSGGFQMASLSKFCNVTEDGVEFKHPETLAKMYLRPEDSIKAQVGIGADIMMALDDVINPTLKGDRVEEACDRTIRWVDRNISANSNETKQSLFPIVQGSINLELRERCVKALVERDTNGYAIGGLSGGESKIDFVRIVHLCCQRLPKDKPRYLMGVGFPIDLVVCAALGVDMFDCVFPTRTARFGVALSDYGDIKLKNAKYKFDFEPIDKNCDCEACTFYTKAFLHSVVCKEEVAAHLLSKHNIRYLLNLMGRFRQAIFDNQLPAFVSEYVLRYYGGKDKLPDWVIEGLKLAEINLNG